MSALQPTGAQLVLYGCLLCNVKPGLSLLRQLRQRMLPRRRRVLGCTVKPASCGCVVHNCGQLNGTVQCGAVLAGCNVCDNCCQTYFHQHSCDGCFAAPVSEQGCGSK